MRVIAILLALSAAGCNIFGPSEDLTGVWTASVLTLGTNDRYTMTLQQDGDTITGIACAKSFNLILFQDVPVYGEYPKLQFTVTATQRVFAGRHEGSKEIVGNFGTYSLRFQRTQATICP
jgi:hypothetical protein